MENACSYNCFLNLSNFNRCKYKKKMSTLIITDIYDRQIYITFYNKMFEGRFITQTTRVYFG